MKLPETKSSVISKLKNEVLWSGLFIFHFQVPCNHSLKNKTIFYILSGQTKSWKLKGNTIQVCITCHLLEFHRSVTPANGRRQSRACGKNISTLVRQCLKELLRKTKFRKDLAHSSPLSLILRYLLILFVTNFTVSHTGLEAAESHLSLTTSIEYMWFSIFKDFS